MLFNSYFFILVFLPVTLLVFFYLGHRGERRAAIAWLVAASLFFYGWWNPAYLGLIAASILFNYIVGRYWATPAAPPRGPQRDSCFGVGVNLLVLGCFKYANFFLQNLNTHLHRATAWRKSSCPWASPSSPSRRSPTWSMPSEARRSEYNFVHYVLFVTYFPHLIAGPILHHREMMPQFGRREHLPPARRNVSVGLTIFVLGLFKKVLLADRHLPSTRIAGFCRRCGGSRT